MFIGSRDQGLLPAENNIILKEFQGGGETLIVSNYQRFNTKIMTQTMRNVFLQTPYQQTLRRLKII